MILPIYTYGTRVLRQKAKPVTRRVDEKLMKFIMDMFDTMHAGNGIGLAANQVGELQRIIVVDISDIDEESLHKRSANDPLDHLPAGKAGRASRKETKSPKLEESKRSLDNHPPFALINPEIFSIEGRWAFEEGCLSIPEVRDVVERAETITLRYKDTNFQDVELATSGLLARVILHEIDHLDGILFVDHLTTPKRRVHKEQLKKIQRGEVEVDYPVITAASHKMEIELPKGV